MSQRPAGTIGTNLSRLFIDAAKNWGGQRIDNIGAPNTDDDVPRARAGDILSGRFGMARMPDGTSGYVLTAQGAGADPAYAAVTADFPMKQKPALVRWVLPGWYCATAGAGLTLAAGRIYYIPIFVSETTTYVRIGGYCSTLSAGTADLRIFAWNNGLPGALILSAGTVNTSTTGDKEITISQQLGRGYYFLAIRCTGTPVFWAPDQNVAPPVPGQATGLGSALSNIIPYADAAYADPAPAPTGMTTARYAVLVLREN
jgi:hypothetical protein